MKLRISLRVLLGLIIVIGIGLAIVRWNDPAVRYRRNHDAASFNRVLARQIGNGDSLVQVEAIVGIAPVSIDPSVRRSASKFATLNPTSYPAGVRDDDEFRAYPYGPQMTLMLQFRGGRLINFDPSEFVSSQPFAGVMAK